MGRMTFEVTTLAVAAGYVVAAATLGTVVAGPVVGGILGGLVACKLFRS